MKKETRIFILIVVISVAVLTAIDIQTKGKVTSLIGSVNPMNLKSSDVPYTNNSQTTVQGAIDDLYSKATAPNSKDNIVHFAFGTPTTSSTTDYTTLNKNVFLALNGGQKSVCIIRNSALHCFDDNNWEIERYHIRQVFSELGNYSSSGLKCAVTSNYISCNASDFYCDVEKSGFVNCRDKSDGSNCGVYSSNSFYCQGY